MSDKLKVILVDDDDDVLKTLGMLFRSAVFEVTSYNNAKDFLQSPMVEEDTALVLDLRMPHVSGLEVLSELKRRNSSLPVIVHSSHADVEATVRVFEDGAYTLVQKPASRIFLSIRSERRSSSTAKPTSILRPAERQNSVLSA